MRNYRNKWKILPRKPNFRTITVICAKLIITQVRILCLPIIISRQVPVITMACAGWVKLMDRMVYRARTMRIRWIHNYQRLIRKRGIGNQINNKSPRKSTVNCSLGRVSVPTEPQTSRRSKKLHWTQMSLRTSKDQGTMLKRAVQAAELQAIISKVAVAKWAFTMKSSATPTTPTNPNPNHKNLVPPESLTDPILSLLPRRKSRFHLLQPKRQISRTAPRPKCKEPNHHKTKIQFLIPNK